MSNITKEQLKKIIDGSPPGTRPEEVIAGLRSRGHKLEGFTATQKETTVTDVAEYEKKSPTLWERYKGLIGLPTRTTFRVAQAAQSFLTETAETIGGVAGGLSMGTKEGLQVAKEELVGGVKDIADIPRQVFGGDIEEMARPSKSLGLGGVYGFLVDVAGDPLNILFAGSAQKDVVTKAKQTVPLTEKFGTRLYQSLFRPSTKKVTKEFAQLGREIDGVVKETPDLLGKNLARYGIKGSVENMLKTMNQRISNIWPKLKSLASESKAKIDTTDVINQLDDMVKSYTKAGKTGVVKTLQARISDLKKLGAKTISVDDAIEIRRIFDDLRLTAGGALSEAQSAEQRAFRIISNGLRNKINKLPGIGPLNKEITTYYDGIQSLAKVAAKEAERILSPITLREFFPYLKVSLGPFAKIKTTVGKAAVDLSKTLNIPLTQVKSALRTILPASMRNIFD